MLDKMMSEVPVNLAATRGLETRMLSAADNGDASTIRKLLKKFVSPNVKDEVGVSALAKASKGGHKEAVKYLLEMKATVNTCDGALVTPLHLAAKGNHCDVVKLLIYHGAKLDARNKSGLRPVDMVGYHADTWQVFQDAARGITPDIEEPSEVPEIPDFAVGAGTVTKKKKKKGKKTSKKAGSGAKKGKKKKKK